MRGKKRLRTFGFWQVFMEKNRKITSLQHWFINNNIINSIYNLIDSCHKSATFYR